MLKILQATLQQYVNLQMFKLELEKAEEPEITLSTSIVSSKIKRVPEKNIYFCFYGYTKAFDSGSQETVENSSRDGNTSLTCLLRNLYAAEEATLRPYMEQWTGSKLGKEYVKAVYCHPVYLAYMQNISCKTPSWMKHKLESRSPGETSVTSDTQMMPPLWQK